MAFLKDLEDLINRHSQENGSDTPDFILANYMTRCLDAFNLTTQERERWYGRACGNGDAMRMSCEKMPISNQ